MYKICSAWYCILQQLGICLLSVISYTPLTRRSRNVHKEAPRFSSHEPSPALRQVRARPYRPPPPAVPPQVSAAGAQPPGGGAAPCRAPLPSPAPRCPRCPPAPGGVGATGVPQRGAFNAAAMTRAGRVWRARHRAGRGRSRCHSEPPRSARCRRGAGAAGRGLRRSAAAGSHAPV